VAENVIYRRPNTLVLTHYKFMVKEKYETNEHSTDLNGESVVTENERFKGNYCSANLKKI